MTYYIGLPPDAKRWLKSFGENQVFTIEVTKNGEVVSTQTSRKLAIPGEIYDYYNMDIPLFEYQTPKGIVYETVQAVIEDVLFTALYKDGEEYIAWTEDELNEWFV